MYTIYYIFFIIVVISFVTGLILNIIENKRNKKKSLEKTKIIQKKDIITNFKEDKLSQTVSFSSPIIISSMEISDEIEILDDGESESFKKPLASSIDDSLI